MRITNVKQQVKNPDRVSIFVDGKYSFSLTLNEIINEKLILNLELTEPELKQLKKLSEDGKLKMRTLAWLMSRPYSSKELRDYLWRKKVEPEQIEDLKDYFSEKGYLNDEQFARWFAEGRLNKHKSWRAITAELSSKGIDQETIQSVVTEQGASDKEEENLKELIVKLSKRSRYKDEKKLIAYLISKGFKYSSIKEALAYGEDA